MTETVLEFGPGRRLMGVLTKPAPDAARHSVAVVITNSGIIHRVGANRLHVRLARLFASHGYPCLRYDLPGIGDSERLGSGASIGEENIAATRAAFDALQKAGVAQRFVIIGLCSGADHSFVMSCVEPRVSATVLIDPTAMFSTKKHRFNLMMLPVRRALRPRALWRLVRGRYRIVRDVRLTVAPEARPGSPKSLSREEHEDAWQQNAAAFRSLIERNVRLKIVITGHNKRVYSYPRQLFEAFPDIAGLEDIASIEHRPHADHTFGAEAERRILESSLIDWLAAAVPADPAVARPAPSRSTPHYRMKSST